MLKKPEPSQNNVPYLMLQYLHHPGWIWPTAGLENLICRAFGGCKPTGKAGTKAENVESSTASKSVIIILINLKDYIFARRKNTCRSRSNGLTYCRFKKRNLLFLAILGREKTW